MHPVLFKIPGLDWPVRMFGLFIIDAFFVASLWVQWHAARKKDPGFAAEEGLNRVFRLLLGGIVLSRILWIAAHAFVGLGWSAVVIGTLVVDYLLASVAWMKLTEAFRRHEKAKVEADFVFNLAFWLLLFGFIGARLFWIITTPRGRESFVEKPLEALFFIWDGGIVYYGGLLCAAGFGVWYLWWKDRKILALGDYLMAGVALTLFIGRWSCFAAGDDFGSPTDKPWGVIFPVDPNSQIPNTFDRPWQGTTALHPTQLYMSLNGLIIFLLLLPVLRKKKFDGQAVFLFLMLYPIGRSIVEIYRGDTGRGLYDLFGMQLSSSQIISIPVFVVAAFLYLRGWLKSRRADDVTARPEEAAV